MTVTVTLTYEVTGNTELALESLRHAFSHNQGRSESISGAHATMGSYSARCVSSEPVIKYFLILDKED